MTKTRKRGKIIPLIVYIILLFLVFGAVGFFWYNTDGFTTKPRTLYITCDNKIVDSKVIELKEQQEYKFDIVSLAEIGNNSAINYDLIIAPKLEARLIKYMVNNEDFHHKTISDFSAAFEVTKNAKSFTIKQNEWNIEKILSKFHADAPIKLIDYQPDIYFSAVITIDKKQIRFDIIAKLESLEFDKGVLFP